LPDIPSFTPGLFWFHIVIELGECDLEFNITRETSHMAAGTMAAEKGYRIAKIVAEERRRDNKSMPTSSDISSDSKSTIWLC
jgi:hypothetical protein